MPPIQWDLKYKNHLAPRVVFVVGLTGIGTDSEFARATQCQCGYGNSFHQEIREGTITFAGKKMKPANILVLFDNIDAVTGEPAIRHPWTIRMDSRSDTQDTTGCFTWAVLSHSTRRRESQHILAQEPGRELSELSEAISSMFLRYEKVKKCYVVVFFHWKRPGLDSMMTAFHAENTAFWRANTWPCRIWKSHKLLLACPYSKQNIGQCKECYFQEFENCRSWISATSDISRIKQHLRRVHQYPGDHCPMSEAKSLSRHEKNLPQQCILMWASPGAQESWRSDQSSSELNNHHWSEFFDENIDLAKARHQTGLGPHAKEPRMGPDDDDDDDCFGFHRPGAPPLQAFALPMPALLPNLHHDISNHTTWRKLWVCRDSADRDCQCERCMNCQHPVCANCDKDAYNANPKAAAHLQRSHFKPNMNKRIHKTSAKMPDDRMIAIWRDAVARTCISTRGHKNSHSAASLACEDRPAMQLSGVDITLMA